MSFTKRLLENLRMQEGDSSEEILYSRDKLPPMKKPFHILKGHDCDSVMVIGHDGHEKCVGEIYGNTFVTKRTPAIHTLRRWNAYGIDESIINSGLFDMIVFQEPEDSWMITLEDFKSHAHASKEEEGSQLFIPKNFLTKM